MNIEKQQETDEEIHLRRMKRIEEMKQEKEKAERMHKLLAGGIIGGILTALVIVAVVVLLVKNGQEEPEESSAPTVSEAFSAPASSEATPEPSAEETPPPKPEYVPFTAHKTSQTTGFSGEIISSYGVVIDVEKQEILAARNESERISPASMTKILTVLTAANQLGITEEDWENNPVLSETFAITREITDYSYVNDCSNVGFDVDEEVQIIDLFYGTILPSGADAALGLAMYVAGSHEAFVDLMNEELASLNVAETTHFTNCVGLYDKEHYSTVYDMAVILKAAMDNPFCRKVLGTRVYTTNPTQRHPEGLVLSNWFLRRIEDRDTHSEVIGAKTGFVVQSKNCAASMAVAPDGREYICVTAHSDSTWKCIYDQVALYQEWIPSE